MAVDARLATADDESSIERLRATADAEMRDAKGGERLLTHLELVETEVVVVGTITGAVVGMLSMSFSGAIATVHELYVEPEAREVGVADRMLEVASDEARSRGCREIDAVVLPGSRASKNFFESHGMVSRLLTVSRSLDAD